MVLQYIRILTAITDGGGCGGGVKDDPFIDLKSYHSMHVCT